MALSWYELYGTSHYQEGPCDCPPQRVGRRTKPESTECRSFGTLRPTKARKPTKARTAAMENKPCVITNMYRLSNGESNNHPVGTIPVFLSHMIIMQPIA